MTADLRPALIWRRTTLADAGLAVVGCAFSIVTGAGLRIPLMAAVILVGAAQQALP